MKIDDFLALLKGVQPAGEGSWVACCPAHGDAHPSMSVTARDGKILVHCHVGCSAADIVGALGLELKDLFEDAPKPALAGAPAGVEGRGDHGAAERAALAGTKRRSGTHGKWVCDYLYHDTDGTILYKVSRLVKADGGKSFVIKHRDETAPGGWAYGLKDVGLPRVVYHLPDVVAAARAGRTVVVAEGEKDVDNLRALGFAATCNAGGAGRWGYRFPEDWGEWFRGARGVVVVADHDAATKTVPVYDRKARAHVERTVPHLVGQKHAWSVRASLVRAGFPADRIRLMVMPKVGDVEPKDFTDWMEARRAAFGEDDDALKRAFREAVKDAAEWPDAWRFADGGVEGTARTDGARAEKGARAAASDPPAGGVEGTGRFGRLRPRAPAGGPRAYEVDFRTGGYRTVGLWLSRDEIYTVRRDVDARGGEVSSGAWRKVPLAMMVSHACWMVAASLGKDGKMSARMQGDVAAVVCLLWLRSRGRFFWDENEKSFATSLYFDEVTGVLMRVRSDEFMSFLATVAEINRESSGFKYLMSLIDDAAMSADASQGVVPSNMWDRRGDAVYVSTGDAEMYRLLDGRVERVQNGTDGVLFMRGKTLAPWTLVDGPGIDPFAHAKIFTGASWADKTGAMNVRLWVLNLFACHQTKPIMLVTGLAQSGKTRMAKAVKEILGVRQDGRLDLSVQQVEDGDKGLDAFWATVNDGRLEVFDNLDTKVKWVGDALQNVATDGQTKRRTLYTTSGVSILRAHAHIILTSNNPLFSTEGAGGMADRLITVNLKTNRSESKDTELSKDIAENRDAFLTWIARTVAAALADTTPVDGSINRRHPDYGIFSVRCGRAFGDEAGVVEALGAAEAEKCLLPLRNDPVAREILSVLERADGRMRFTGGQMSDLILARLDDGEPDEKAKAFYSSRKVGKALSRYKRQFETIFNMLPARTLDGRTTYEATGFTALGALQVDKVDFNTQNAGVRMDARGAGEFPKYGAPNPLNPLDAGASTRARAGASSLFSREKEKESKDESMDTPGWPDGGDDDGLDF